MLMKRLEEWKEETKIYMRDLGKWQLKKEVYDEAIEQGVSRLPELPPVPIPPIRPDGAPTRAEIYDMVARARLYFLLYLLSINTTLPIKAY